MRSLLLGADTLPGIVVLADLIVVPERTALIGTAFLLDMFVIAPGLHRQQEALSLNRGEYPACAAMTTGYVFRIENQATVYFLQKIGQTGHLTTLAVSESKSRRIGCWRLYLRMFYDLDGARDFSELTYVLAVAMSLTVLILLALSRDWWCLAFVFILVMSRLINVIVIRRRASADWSGAPEPGVRGDLIVLLSQDRWIRMKGYVDDLKAVTSGHWLRDPSFIEHSLVALSTFLVYMNAVFVGNAREESKLLLLSLLFCSTGLLGVANRGVKTLQMKGRLIRVESRSHRYTRRLDLAEQLVMETGRDDWAVRLGMLTSRHAKEDDEGNIAMKI